MYRFRCALHVAVTSLLFVASAHAAVPDSHQSVTPLSRQLFYSIDTFWSQQLASLGGHYRSPKWQLFTAPLSGICTVQAALSGPFYCTVNETVFLDQSFLRQLMPPDPDVAKLMLGFVVAHEVAHHIQNVIGTTGSVDQSRANSTPALAQRIFTTFELQADCYAGLWLRWAAGHSTIKIPGDLSVTLAAIAKASQDWRSHLSAGEEMLDPLSLGTGEQRLKWVHRGMDSGNFNDCDTFGAEAAGNL